MLTPIVRNPGTERELASYETASTTQISKTSARIAPRLVAPSEAGANAADHAADAHSTQTSGLCVLAVDHHPDLANRRLTLLTRGALSVQRPADLETLSEHCMTSTRATNSRMPITSQNSPTEGRRLIEARRRDSDSDPARVSHRLAQLRESTLQGTRREGPGDARDYRSARLGKRGGLECR